MSLRKLLLSAVALLPLSAPAVAEDVAITNATVVIGDGSAPIPNGTVVLRAGKVLAAGAGVAVPAGARTIDASGKWVTPGLVVAVTDIGLFDVEGVEESNDERADKGPFSAALDLSPAINPLAQHIGVSRAGGVTRAAVARCAPVRSLAVRARSLTWPAMASRSLRRARSRSSNWAKTEPVQPVGAAPQSMRCCAMPSPKRANWRVAAAGRVPIRDCRTLRLNGRAMRC